MLDRGLALISLAVLLAFMGIVAVRVGEVDLIIVFALVAAMAIYDFIVRPILRNGGRRRG